MTDNIALSSAIVNTTYPETTPSSQPLSPTLSNRGKVTSLQEYKQRKPGFRKPEKFLFDDSFVPLHEQVSVALGLTEALILAKLFAWMGSLHKDEIYMSRSDWQKNGNLPAVKVGALRKALLHLTNEKILLQRYDRFNRNRSVYQINLQRLNEFTPVPTQWLKVEEERQEEREKEQGNQGESTNQLATRNQLAGHPLPASWPPAASSSIDTKITFIDNDKDSSSEEKAQIFSQNLEDKDGGKKGEEKQVVGEKEKPQSYPHPQSQPPQSLPNFLRSKEERAKWLPKPGGLLSMATQIKAQNASMRRLLT